MGKKIAERILLELRDKLKIKVTEEVKPALLSADAGAYSDAFSALVNLGYRAAEAEKALRKAQERLDENPPLEKLLKESLRILA